jgi:hypothetical protein
MIDLFTPTDAQARQTWLALAAARGLAVHSQVLHAAQQALAGLAA